MDKLAIKINTGIHANFKDPVGLTKNASRAKIPLVRAILLKRKHADVTETDSFFHSFAKEGNLDARMRNKKAEA